VQLALRPDPTGLDRGAGPSPSASRMNQIFVAGVALIGASLIAVNPGTPSLPNVQHRLVQLTAGEADWSQVLAAAEDNLTPLESDATTANSDLSTAIGAEFGGYGDQLSTALSNVETNLGDIVYGGWYGSDDGYVFGLFGGSVTDPTTGVTETGSTLQEIATALQQGTVFDAFSYFDTWSLESVDHTLRYLTEPFLSLASHGTTTESTVAQLLQTFTNAYEEFGTYTNLKDLSDALLSPALSVAFGLSQDLDRIATDLSSGNVDQALTDLGNLPSDLTGDLPNGYTDPSSAGEAFTGLLNGGSLLDDLLVTWPTDLATALGESTAPESGAAVATALPDLLGGLFSL
jgi:hypothetical protein